MIKMRRVGEFKWVASQDQKQASVRDAVAVKGPTTRQGIRDLNAFGVDSRPSLEAARRRQEIAGLLCDHRFECLGHVDVCERCNISDECAHFYDQEETVEARQNVQARM